VAAKGCRMSERAVLDRVRDCVVNLDLDGIKQACNDALAAGIPPYRVVTDAMAKGMEVVGQKYEASEYFLSELIVAGETMKEGLKIIQPLLRKGDIKPLGRVAIGTVKGDLHDIGKNIVVMLLEAAGFEVIDLGTDVTPEKFVEAVREKGADIVGMSALLTSTMTEMENVVKRLEESNLRKRVKIIIGGAPITPEYGLKIGVDHAAKDAVEGVNVCKAWMQRT